MAKKHKHEEHQNHERWVISYADMVTLLFALFVVLYALGEVKLKKLKDLKQSLQFAFHFKGEGQTQVEGEHNKGEVGGQLLEAMLSLNPQSGAIKEFLMQTLPNEFEEITGRSIEPELHDDMVRFSGPLSAFFARNSKTLKPDVHQWLTDLVETAHKVASEIRIRIQAPEVRIGQYRDGTTYYSRDLCLERLAHLHDLVGLMSNVMKTHVSVEFDYTDDAGNGATWEDQAVIAFSFSSNGN